MVRGKEVVVGRMKVSDTERRVMISGKQIFVVVGTVGRM